MVGDIYKKNYVGNRIAINFKENSISYEQLDKKVLAFAAYLKKLGIRNGDRVVLSCPNCPEFVYSYLGTVRGGAIIVPINLLLTMGEIQYIVNDCEAKYMIVHQNILKYANITQDMLGKALGITIIIIDEKFEQHISEISTEGLESFSDENAVSTFLYTSGTTGKQKAVMLTHKNLLVNAEQCRAGLHANHEDSYLCVLPMFHAFAFTACILMPLYSGSTITIMESFKPKEVIETLGTKEITIFMGVPSMYAVIIKANKEHISFPKLRIGVCGGSSLPIEIYKQVKEIYKVPIIEGYGLTEASPAATFNPTYGIQKPGSIGLPLKGIECKIVDEEGNELPTGEVGELILRGENIMLGYYNDPEETARTLKGGWLHTGDMAKMDEEGYLYIVDRKKDMVNVSGLNVYPREIEEVLYQFPKVHEAAVIGVPDKLRGEYVKAFVVLNEDEECNSKELIQFLSDRLASYKIPREIEFLQSLPKNSTGKIMKKVLREQL